MILFFDVETTGFFQDRLPFIHLDQPRLVQIAALLTDDSGKQINSFALIVNPGIPIPERASAVHGITDEIASKFGVPETTALGILGFMARRADIVVAHNAKFDIGVMECVSARAAVREDSPPSLFFEMPKAFCTMEAAAPIIKLPPTDRMKAVGFDKPKPPKLEECVRHFFNEELDGAHDAMVDVDACRRVYFHLKTLEVAS